MMDDPREETLAEVEENILWVHNIFEVVIVYLDRTHTRHVCK